MQGRSWGNVAAERLCGTLFVGLTTLKGYFLHQSGRNPKKGNRREKIKGSVTTLIGRGSDHFFLARLKRDHEATSFAASTQKTLFAFVLAPAIAHFKKMPFVQTYRDQPIQFVACNVLSTAPAAPRVFRNVLPGHCFRSARNRVAGPRQVAIVALDRVWSFWDHPPAWPA